MQLQDPKIVLVLLRSNLAQWARLLQDALPHHRVITDPAQAGSAAIPYAVVSKPARGVLATISGLEVLFSVNAGVESLIESGEVPAGLPIVRMVDEGLAEGMLDWVLATCLAWHRNLFDYRALQLAGEWRPLAEIVARERTVTVLGAGHLGGRVAKALAAIGFRTTTWSRTSKINPGVRSLHGAGSLDEAVTGAQILINLLPLTPATENLIDHRLVSLLAPQAVLINAGRGRHLVEEDVLGLLDSGHLRAAVLDVFREEPVPAGSRFWTHPRVFLTPHVAAITQATTAVTAIADNLRDFEVGKPLRHVVDVVRGY